MAISAIFGCATLALRASNLTIPIGGPFVIDARGIPGVIGAAFSGPIGGLIVGFLAGISAQILLIDIPSFMFAYFVVGVLANMLTRFKWLSALGGLTGYPIAAVIAWQMGLFPTFYASIGFLAPRMVVVLVQLALLYIIFKRYPNILDFIK